jgi:NADPH2:quinone reductase
MKAAVFTEFGSPDVLGIQEIDRPVPCDGEVLIKVYATTVTMAES